MYLQSSKLCLCISDAIAPLYNDWLWLSDLSLIAALVVFLLLRTWKPTSVVPRSSLNLDSCGYTWYMASSFKNTVSDVCAEWQCLPKVVPRDYIDHTCMTDSRAVLPEGLKVTRIQQWFPSLAWEYWEFIRLLEYFHNIILCRCWKTKVLCIYALEEIFFYMTGDSLIDFDKVVSRNLFLFERTKPLVYVPFIPNPDTITCEQLTGWLYVLPVKYHWYIWKLSSSLSQGNLSVLVANLSSFFGLG